MATVTDVSWIEDRPNDGFRSALAVEFKMDGKWYRNAKKFSRPDQKEQIRQDLIAWAAERGADLNHQQAAQ